MNHVDLKVGERVTVSGEVTRVERSKNFDSTRYVTLAVDGCPTCGEWKCGCK